MSSFFNHHLSPLRRRYAYASGRHGSACTSGRQSGRDGVLSAYVRSGCREGSPYLLISLSTCNRHCGSVRGAVG